MKEDASIKNGRRDFILKSFSSCALCCFAAPTLFGSEKKLHPIASDQKHKFQSDSGMTMQQVYNFTYKQWYIPVMKNLMKQIGKEKFLEMLKTSSEMLYENDENADIDYSERTLTAYANNVKQAAEGFYKQRATFEFISSDENILELKVVECLWAKTFREADASEIGYAGFCYQDYPEVKAFNPNIKLIRETTLMQGHDCCHFKWVKET